MSSAYFGRTTLVHDRVVASAQRKTLVDTSDRTYDDLVSGALAMNFGYTDSRLAGIVGDYAHKLPFLHGRNFASPEMIALAERLSVLRGHACRVAFGVTGSDAIELALRIAWLYHGAKGARKRRRTLSFGVSYHGSTLAALSHSHFPGRAVYRDFADVGNGHTLGFTYSQGETGVELAFDEEARAFLDGDLTEFGSAIIEPVSANAAGCMRISNESLRILRDACSRHDIVLIYDEIATSMGRIGSTFFETQACAPADISVVSKGLTAGFYPLSAALVSDAIASRIEGTSFHNLLGHTYAGQPVAGRLGLEIVDRLTSDNYLDAIRQRGRRIAQLLAASNLFQEVRQEGLLLAGDLERAVSASTVNRYLLEHGVLALSGERPALTGGATTTFVTFAPLFEIGEQEIDESFGRVVDLLKAFAHL